MSSEDKCWEAFVIHLAQQSRKKAETRSGSEELTASKADEVTKASPHIRNILFWDLVLIPEVGPAVEVLAVGMAETSAFRSQRLSCTSATLLGIMQYQYRKVVRLQNQHLLDEPCWPWQGPLIAESAFQ